MKTTNNNANPGNNMSEPFDKPNLKSVMHLYVVVFISLLLLASWLQAWNFEYGMILTQVVFILLPALWYWRRYQVDQVVFARLHPLKARFVPAIILLSASMWLFNMVLAASLVGALIDLGFEPLVVLEPPQTLQQYLIYIIIIVVFAGICEEVFFRGTIMPAMEGHGLIPAIVFSSFLFALFHGSFLSFFSTFILGMVIAVIVIKTGSLWGGILYHMLNNFYGVTVLYTSEQYEIVAGVEPEGFLVSLPLLVIAMTASYAGLIMLQKHSKIEPLLRNRENWLPRGWLSWRLIIGLIIFLTMAMLEMAVGFNLFSPAK